MGIWRSHHSIGNIAGSLIAGAFVEYSWGLSFAVPAVIIFSLGLLTFTFLVPDPRAVGCPVPVHNIDESVYILYSSCVTRLCDLEII
jgi:OPA family glycerol-3-phosphate transporter-like MFS transporter 1/2